MNSIFMPPGLGQSSGYQPFYGSSSSLSTNPDIQFYQSNSKGKSRQSYGQDDDGEEESLIRARRALWFDEDIPVSTTKGDEAQCTAEEGQGDESVDGLDPFPSQPLHSILTPLPSCLRPPINYSHCSRPPTASSVPASTLSLDSASETSTSSLSSLHSSVHFSDTTPTTATTWSASDYSRKGPLPLVKLSLKEWVELRDVRGAVGVFSGKVAKWIEEEEDAREECEGNCSEDEGMEKVKCSFSKVITLHQD